LVLSPFYRNMNKYYDPEYAKRYYCKHKAEKLAYGQKHYQSHKNDPKVIERESKYREANKEKLRERHAQYYIKNRDKIRGNLKRWRKENLEKFRSLRRRQSYEPKGKYTTYKHQAKRRGIDFVLSFEEFMTFWQKSCWYCHNPIKTIGLDRVDNFLGYSIQNVVSCCKPCNDGKNCSLQNEYIERCKRIARFH